MNSGFSDEHLNAYLDNQLDAEERSLLLEELRRDQELAARVCKLQKVQDMVQLAYHNVAREQSTGSGRRRWSLYFAQAASALLVLGLGLTIGWLVTITCSNARHRCSSWPSRRRSLPSRNRMTK